MQQNLIGQEETSASSSSDVLGTPPFQETGARKRDSGYCTDYSPASVTSQGMKFTYDEDLDLSGQIDELNLVEEPLDNCNDNTCDVDREVEDVFASSVCSPHSVSCPVAIQRPSAPINTPKDNNDTEDGEPCPIINFPYHAMLRGNHMINYRRSRPLVSRGTQTPPLVQENVNSSISGNPGNIPRFHPYPRGGAFARLRHYSDGEKVTGTSPPGPLPDVVPISRDRSISLPDVPSFRHHQSELDVGRELRRISDEFHLSYSRTSRLRCSDITSAYDEIKRRS
ncbi:hypothetical protein CHS0354_011700 [Potamilus streckersoni]|uniref:Uncharacterized protein n=1 Tax=Potamilus streckersoni TaxID=2493646 RepID=A0AAE0SJH3_9BIVA|nr:hypothetical protein CHS0354_011700 [Potamilus streckersoni]